MRMRTAYRNLIVEGYFVQSERRANKNNKVEKKAKMKSNFEVRRSGHFQEDQKQNKSLKTL